MKSSDVVLSHVTVTATVVFAEVSEESVNKSSTLEQLKPNTHQFVAEITHQKLV